MKMHLITQNTRARIILILLVLSFSKSYSQATETSIRVADTTGSLIQLELKIPSADLGDCVKIIFSKRAASLLVIKEFSVKPIGSYFLLEDGQNKLICQQTLRVRFSVNKNDYPGIQALDYKFIYADGHELSFAVAKPGLH